MYGKNYISAEFLNINSILCDERYLEVNPVVTVIIFI